MKKQIILSTIVLGALVGGTYAMYGQGNGQGRGMGHGHGMGQGFGKTLTAEQRKKLQSMSMEERRAYVQKLRAEQGLTTGQGMRRGQSQAMGQRGGQVGQAQQRMQEDPSQMLSQYPVSNLTEELKEGLYDQYGEEKMARDLYAYATEKYPNVSTFANISKSEQRHMDAIKALLDRYGITPPSDYAKDTELAEQLKSKIDEGLEQALNVGVTIEEVDIKDIVELAKQAYDANAKDLLAVYTNIAGGSYNHLRGFLQSLKNSAYTLPNVSKYLPSGVTVDQLLEMRGPDAKKLFVDYVKEHYGIDLSDFQQQCQQNKSNMQSTTGQTQGVRRGQVQRQSQQAQNMTQPVQRQSQIQSQQMNQIRTEVQKYANPTKVEQYKKIIEDKYASKLNKLSQDKLNTINKKIDVLLDKIVNGNYSDKKKEIYTNVLLALKASILDRLDNKTSDDIINSVLSE